MKRIYTYITSTYEPFSIVYVNYNGKFIKTDTALSEAEAIQKLSNLNKSNSDDINKIQEIDIIK
jgi:hypothetical protein